MKRVVTILLISLMCIFLVNCDEEIDRNRSENDFSFSFRQASNINISINDRNVYNENALAYLTRAKNDSLNRERIFTIGNNYWSVNDWVSLRKVINILEQRIDHSNSTFQIAHLYRLYGSYYTNQSINDSAYYYFFKAEKIYRKQNSNELLCRVFQNKAQVQYYCNDYLGSESSLIEALKIAKSKKLLNDKVQIYNLLGVISNDLRQFDKASLYHNRALQIVNNFNIDDEHTRLRAMCLNYIGFNLFSSGDVREAQETYRQAIDELKMSKVEYKYTDIYTKLLDNFAHSKAIYGDRSGLPELFLRSATIRDSFNIQQGQNFNRLYLSEYYTAVKDTVKAKQYANEAYSLSKSFKAPNDMLMCLKHLTKIDPHNAMDYSARYIKISDSMQQLERETRNKFAKIAYETEEITQEKELAERHKSIWASTTLAVTGFGMLLFVIARQRIRQKELLLVQTQQEAKEEIYQLMHTQQSKIDAGRETEKKRIARDLHDGIMNRLASTRFNLHILNTKTDKQTIQNCISYIDNIHEIEKEIRNISHDLNRDVFAENDSFKRILFSFFDEQKNILTAKLHIDIDKRVKWEHLKSSQKINLYRILQESFQNTTKHARAENIFVSIANKGEYVLLEIHDDGIGFTASEQKKGIGLQNLRARAKDCEGIFHINSAPGNGTTIIISIPIDKQNLT